MNTDPIPDREELARCRAHGTARPLPCAVGSSRRTQTGAFFFRVCAEAMVDRGDHVCSGRCEGCSHLAGIHGTPAHRIPKVSQGIKSPQTLRRLRASGAERTCSQHFYANDAPIFPPNHPKVNNTMNTAPIPDREELARCALPQSASPTAPSERGPEQASLSEGGGTAEGGDGGRAAMRRAYSPRPQPRRPPTMATMAQKNTQSAHSKNHTPTMPSKIAPGSRPVCAHHAKKASAPAMYHQAPFTCSRFL